MAGNRNLILVRPKDVIYGEDFRRNEQTIYRAFKKARIKLGKFRGDPKRNEVYCFVSCRGDQILWVWHVSTTTHHAGTRYACERDGIVSIKYRIEGGHFSAASLQHYANAVGFRLPDTFKPLHARIRQHWQITRVENAKKKVKHKKTSKKTTRRKLSVVRATVTA